MTYSDATGDNEKDKFFAGTNQETIVRVGNNSDNPISIKTGISLPEWNKVLATYPTSSTEVYTYSFNAIDVAVVTVVYTSAAKNDLVSVIKTVP